MNTEEQRIRPTGPPPPDGESRSAHPCRRRTPRGGRPGPPRAIHLVGPPLRSPGRHPRTRTLRHRAAVDARPRARLRREPAAPGLPRHRRTGDRERRRTRRLGGAGRRGQRQPARPLHRPLPHHALPGVREHRRHRPRGQDPDHGRRADRGARSPAPRAAHARRPREVRHRAGQRTRTAPSHGTSGRSAANPRRSTTPTSSSRPTSRTPGPPTVPSRAARSPTSPWACRWTPRCGSGSFPR